MNEDKLRERANKEWNEMLSERRELFKDYSEFLSLLKSVFNCGFAAGARAGTEEAMKVVNELMSQ